MFFRLIEVLTEKSLLKQSVNTSINRKNIRFIFSFLLILEIPKMDI